MREIKIGSMVRFCFHDGEILQGIVHYIPCATGDCWRIEDCDGDEVRIQNFDLVTLMEDSGTGRQKPTAQ